MNDYCPKCDSDNVRVVSAGLDWLCECMSCHHYWHISDLEVRRV